MAKNTNEVPINGLYDDEGKIFPIEAPGGVKVMSFGFFDFHRVAVF